MCGRLTRGGGTLDTLCSFFVCQFSVSLVGQGHKMSFHERGNGNQFFVKKKTIFVTRYVTVLFKKKKLRGTYHMTI
jgi:hypothetical protein